MSEHYRWWNSNVLSLCIPPSPVWKCIMAKADNLPAKAMSSAKEKPIAAVVNEGI